MNIVNISSTNDPFYRYKMEDIQTEYIVKCSKTNITNIDSISKSLSRSSDEIMKYFSYRVGTSVKGSNLCGIVDTEKLRSYLNDYISIFVLCDICDNPETEYIEKKKKTLYKNCKACGSISKLKLNDNEKIYRYILKNVKT